VRFETTFVTFAAARGENEATLEALAAKQALSLDEREADEADARVIQFTT
jgi:hypothetical protein